VELLGRHTQGPRHGAVAADDRAVAVQVKNLKKQILKPGDHI
jgi:hypothetical protein